MLKVTIENGDYEPKTHFINDLLDLKAVQGILVDEYNKVWQEDEESYKERLTAEILRGTGYDTIEGLTERIAQLEMAISDIEYATSMVAR